MPNHLTSVCTITGDAATIDAFVAAHFRNNENGKPFFDFGSIVTKPEIVDKTQSGSVADEGFFALTGFHHVTFACFSENPLQLAIRHGRFTGAHQLTTVNDYRAWLEKERPEAIEQGRMQLQCFLETGHRNWYDWNVANWGTKWGAYDYKPRFREPQKLVFEFQTAWSFPRPIFEALHGRYPGLLFEGVTIDEGGPEYEWRYGADETHFEKVEPSNERYRFVYAEDREEEEDS